MGKKTLKQKKRTDEKKLHHTSSPVNKTIGNDIPSTPTYTFSSPHKIQVSQPQTHASSESHVTYVTQDLKKTLLLSLCIDRKSVV